MVNELTMLDRMHNIFICEALSYYGNKNLYNLNNTLFSPLDIEDVRNYVQQYLLKNSKSPQSLIENTGRRGFYRLNTQNNADARQLMLEFKSHTLKETSESEEISHPDLSLDLFG